MRIQLRTEVSDRYCYNCASLISLVQLYYSAVLLRGRVYELTDVRTYRRTAVRTYGRTYGRTDVRTYVWKDKIFPAFYRILSLWGRWPKSEAMLLSLCYSGAAVLLRGGIRCKDHWELGVVASSSARVTNTSNCFCLSIVSKSSFCEIFGEKRG